MERETKITLTGDEATRIIADFYLRVLELPSVQYNINASWHCAEGKVTKVELTLKENT